MFEICTNLPVDKYSKFILELTDNRIECKVYYSGRYEKWVFKTESHLLLVQLRYSEFIVSSDDLYFLWRLSVHINKEC